jgi:hypothetical protein
LLAGYDAYPTFDGIQPANDPAMTHVVVSNDGSLNAVKL